jgi:hypothetical protein
MGIQNYIKAGQEVKWHFEGGTISISVLSDLETLELRRFGMLVMLAGCIRACMLMPGVSTVIEAAEARHRTVGAAPNRSAVLKSCVCASRASVEAT